jgi:hypothetical protein
MLSLVEITCPHCGAKGQVVLPSTGAIVLGPCPRCDEFVLVFCGRALALERAAVTEGSLEKRREYLLDVLTSFLRERLDEILGAAEVSEAVGDDLAATEPVGFAEIAGDGEAIDAEEFEHFVNVDLELLDDPNYFRAIFG